MNLKRWDSLHVHSECFADNLHLRCIVLADISYSNTKFWYLAETGGISV